MTKSQSIPGNSVVASGGLKSLSMLANSLTLIVGKLATMGLGFLAWVVAARIFDQHEVGLASGSVSAMMICVQVALFGAGAAIISLYPQYKDNPDKLLNSSFTMVTVSSFLVSLLFLGFAALALDQLKSTLTEPVNAIALTIMIIAGTLGVLLDQLSTGLRRGDQALVRGVVTGLVTIGLVVLLPVWFGSDKVETLLLAWAGGNVAPVLVGAWQIRKSLPEVRFRPGIDWHLFRQINHTGIPNWVLTLTERLPGAILPLIVIEILSPQANAAWYAAWMMAWVVYVVPIQIGLNLFAEAAHRPEQIDRALRQGVLTSLLIGAVAAVAAAVIGPYLLEFLGSGYADEGTQPLRILVLAVFPFTFIQAYFAVCRSQFRLREAIFTGLVAGITGVGLAAYNAERNGLDGMAIAWLATQTVIAIWAIFRTSQILSGTNGREPNLVMGSSA